MYDHTMGIPQKREYGGKGEIIPVEHFGEIIGIVKEELIALFVGVMGYECDGVDYYNEDWGNSACLGGHPLIQVTFAKTSTITPHAR